MRVQTPTAPLEIAAGRGPLVERELELARLGAAVEQARRGSGALAIVEGHAGIGKSRLLAATADAALREGVTVLRARGSELEAEIAHGVVLQLLEPVVSGGSPAEREALLADAAAPAEPLLTGREPLSAAPAHPRGHALRRGLFHVVSRLAGAAPVLLVIDDAQWADEASLRFVLYLVARLDALAIAVALAAHPMPTRESRPLLERLATDPAAELVVPAPLSPVGVAGLLRETLRREPDKAFVRACVQATGGVPLLVRELARALARERIAPREALAPRALAMGTDSVARALLVRLARLPRGTLGLARAISVLGDEAPLRHAGALADLDLPSAGAAADALAAEGVLEPGEPLRFAHPILRSSLYGELPSACRAELHARAARLLAQDGLSAERIGAQLIPGGAQGEPWTVDVLEAAAARARDRGAWRSAVRYLRRALAEPPAPPRRAAVLRALGDAEAACGDRQALERFQEAAELAPEPVQRATALEAAGRMLSDAGRTRDAAAAFDRALAEVGPAPGEAPSELAVRLETGYVTAAGHDPALRASALARLEALDPEHAQPTTPGGRALLAHAAQEGALGGAGRAEVLGLARRALAGDQDPRDPADGGTRWLAVGALLWVDELEEAKRILDRGLAEARLRGWAGAVATGSRWRARVLLRRGLVTDALADAGAAQREGGPGRALSRPALAPLVADALIERGELESAARALEPAARENPLDAVTDAEILAARGRLRLAQGRPRLALRDFVDSGRRLDAIGARSPAVVPWRSGAALACTRLSDRGQGRRLAARELELARQADAPRAVAVARRTLALVEEDPERRVALLREAAEAAALAGDSLERAHALCRLGAELPATRTGPDDGEAEGALHRALELAETAGATALARRAREELAAGGVPPGHGPHGGAAALTPGERRVAELAAEGLTNRQIAQTLFVTVKTVEWHLRNAFVKLRISSRRDLRPVLRNAA